MGHSTAPQPKGPYKISAKGYTIEFKNPFFDAMDFVIRIDNPNFSVSAKNQKYDSKKPMNLAVQYKPQPNTPTSGRLIVQTANTDFPPWIFYLQGEQ